MRRWWPRMRVLWRGRRGSVQGALRALSGSRFFAALGERALLGDLRQVRDYIHEPEIRQPGPAAGERGGRG